MLHKLYMAKKNRAETKRKRLWPHVYTRIHASGQTSFVVDLSCPGWGNPRVPGTPVPAQPACVVCLD